MALEKHLAERANNACELCGNAQSLMPFPLPYSPDTTPNCAVLLCSTCFTQVEGGADLDTNHWRCLADSMWSTTPAVQVLAYRMLGRLSTESWAQDLTDILYLEDDVKQWAEAGMVASDEPTLDVNGVVLKAGDNVTIIKDLDVKGAGFTAKRGTPVRNIGLCDNPLHLEGRVNGQRIVLVAAYTKKM
ncbi:MAG: PhnA domain-containing protein [Glaciecola sp.]|jgi:protein PhnA